MGKDVTIRHRYGKEEYEVVIKAPVANVPAETDEISFKKQAN